MQRDGASRYRQQLVLSQMLLGVLGVVLAACGAEPPGEPGEENGTGGGASEPPFLFEEPECPESTQGFASEVISFEFGEGQDFGQDAFPDSVLGGPRGGGCCQGSLHVTSLGDGG